MDKSRGRRLATFGAVMLIFAGAVNVLDGVVALAKPEYLNAHLLVGNLTAWGWFIAIFGAVQALVGIVILRGSEIALWPGIVLAGVNSFTQFANLEHYPLWSITVMVADVIVIYAFAVRAMALGVEEVESEPVTRIAA